MEKIGLASIAFRHLSVEEIIACAKEAGLGYIEWGSDVHAPKDDAENLDRVARLTREAGLRISSYGTYFRIDRDKPEEIVAYIQAAKRLGTNIVRIWCSGNPAVLTAEETKARYETCRQIARIAEEMGAVVCAECHENNLTDNADSSLALMEAVSSPAFRMYWQPHPNQSGNWNTAFAEMTEKHIEHVHVFNWHGRDRFPLEEAWNDWVRYARALGNSRMYLLEHFVNDDPALLSKEADTLRKIIKEI